MIAPSPRATTPADLQTSPSHLLIEFATWMCPISAGPAWVTHFLSAARSCTWEENRASRHSSLATVRSAPGRHGFNHLEKITALRRSPVVASGQEVMRRFWFDLLWLLLIHPRYAHKTHLSAWHQRSLSGGALEHVWWTKLSWRHTRLRFTNFLAV